LILVSILLSLSLISWAITELKQAMVNILFYISMAISLLCSNIPKVIDIPLHYAYPIKTVEYFTFFVSLHHFVEYIESTLSFAPFFSTAKKGSRAAHCTAL